MPHLSPTLRPATIRPMPLSGQKAASPLVLCDRLITLAQDADRAGFAVTAEHLVHLAHSMFEEPRTLT